MKSDERDNELDTLLKSCLHTEWEPGDVLHQKVLKKWKEPTNMKNRKSLKAAAAAIAVIMASALSVSAAIRFLSPKEAAAKLEGAEAAELFETDDAVLVNETQEGTQYNFTLLGMTEGKNLRQLDDDGNVMEKDSFYAVVAITNKDGSSLSLEDFQNSENGYFMSPLIQGLKPWQYNIASMNGGYSETELDGTVYRMINCDKIGYFADRSLYLCISDTSFYDTKAYNYNEEAGTIAPNDNYKGTNLLFDLPIDKSRANGELAEKYLEEIEKEWTEDNTDDETEDDSGITNPAALADYRLYQETFRQTPDELDTVLTNAGMSVASRQTAAEEDGAFHFKEELKDGGFNDIVFYKEIFENGLADSCSYSESETEASLVIMAAKLNDDGTATCTFYEKKYPIE